MKLPPLFRTNFLAISSFNEKHNFLMNLRLIHYLAHNNTIHKVSLAKKKKKHAQTNSWVPLNDNINMHILCTLYIWVFLCVPDANEVTLFYFCSFFILIWESIVCYLFIPLFYVISDRYLQNHPYISRRTNWENLKTNELSGHFT